MADNTDAASEATLTFKVKTSGDKNHTITMAESATVLDLKTKLAGEDFENIPIDRQRLIYSGRVMKNDDTLATYKVKSGNTIHMVKSAASNPASAPPVASVPTPPAVPQNMAAGTAANNILAGLTGARFAGHANLPNRDLFGADGGMGAPPSEEQMANMLSDPAVAQTMNEALNNPQFVEHMIQSNPTLAQMPNAREMLQSPYFRSMMTNPEALRMAARMRRMMAGGGGGAGAFPAPGATDTTPAGAPSSDGTAGADGAGQPPLNPFALPGLFGAPVGGGAAAGADANPFAALLRGAFPAPASPPTAQAASPPAPDSSTTQRSTTGNPAQPPPPSGVQANPFASLFGPLPGAQGGRAGPVITPEMWQQAMDMVGSGGAGSFFSPAAASPPDNRPPEERYAEQLRQLNDMGFFDFDRNITALRRSGGSVQGAIEHLLNGS